MRIIRIYLELFGRCRIFIRQTIEGSNMSLGFILIILLLLMLLGVIPNWNHSRSWGYFPSGALGTVLIVVIVLVVLGRL